MVCPRYAFPGMPPGMPARGGNRGLSPVCPAKGKPRPGLPSDLASSLAKELDSGVAPQPTADHTNKGAGNGWYRSSRPFSQSVPAAKAAFMGAFKSSQNLLR